MKLRVGLACYLFLLSILSSPIDTFANGAVGGPGLYGNEIIVSDSSPMNNLVVDEEVVLDYRNKTVKVDYKILNKSAKTFDFTMVFPIDDHRTLCNTEMSKQSTKGISYEDELNFRVLLNKKNLPSRQVSLSDIQLQGDYDRLRKTACYSFTFPIHLQPGSNYLQIIYNLIPSISWGDGIGGGRYYSYAIWPAKNWVPVFRKALWRVFLPEKSKRGQEFFIGGNLKHQFEDWYTNGDDTRLFNWHKYGFDVQGPGKKIEYPGHIDIVADNFVPDGSIVINLYMHELTKTVKGCEAKDLKDCWQKALQSTLSIRPYRGDKSCYDASDLYVVLVNNPSHIDEFIFLKSSIAFLRNEIYARKGYIFTSDSYRRFFEQMPWYKPKHNDVQLSEIEKWNVEFLYKLEIEIKPKNKSNENVDEPILIYEMNDDTDQVTQIYRRMRKTCPSVP